MRLGVVRVMQVLQDRRMVKEEAMHQVLDKRPQAGAKDQQDQKSGGGREAGGGEPMRYQAREQGRIDGEIDVVGGCTESHRPPVPKPYDDFITRKSQLISPAPRG